MVAYLPNIIVSFFYFKFFSKYIVVIHKPKLRKNLIDVNIGKKED